MKKFVLNVMALTALMAFGLVSQAAKAFNGKTEIVEVRGPGDMNEDDMMVRVNAGFIEASLNAEGVIGGQMALYDRMGREIVAPEEFVFENGYGRLKISGRLASGVYIAVFESEQGKAFSAKLLVTDMRK